MDGYNNTGKGFDMNEAGYSANMTLRDYVRVLFRYKYVILITAITVMGTVALGLKMKTPVYVSSVKMLISAEKQVESPFYRDIMSSRNTEITLTQSEIVKSEPVLRRVIQALGLQKRPMDYEKEFASPIKDMMIDWNIKKFEKKYKDLEPKQREGLMIRRALESLKDSVSVSPIRDTNLFTISAKDFSPFFATVIANVVSRSYVIFDLEQQLSELKMKYGQKHPAVRQLEDNIESMRESLNGKPLSSLAALGPASVKIIEQAQVPLKPSGTPKMLTMLLAVVMGPFLGIMLAFVFEYMDQTFKSPIEIESVLGVPYLGDIPRKRFKAGALIKREDKIRSSYAKAYQTLVDQVYMLIKDKELKVISLASVRGKEGASTCTANIATLLANKLHHSVLVIDANLRHPGLHKKFKGMSNKKGLSDIVLGKASFDEACCKLGEQVTFLPSGRTELNPLTILDSKSMKEFIADVRDQFEVILIDAPPVSEHQDVSVLASISDGFVGLVSEGQTRRQVAASAFNMLKDRDLNVLGVVLNHRTYPIPGFIYNII